MPGFGYLPPPDREHIARYPLWHLTEAEMPVSVPMVIGINWYRSFMDDMLYKQDNVWRIRDASGGILGGHAICIPNQHQSDRDSWRRFYNQGNTGECVGFSSSRMMSLLNREMYDAPWLYFQAQDLAGQPRDDQAGTYVRSAMGVLVGSGEKTPRGKPNLSKGIEAYRWAQSVDEMRNVLNSPLHDKRGAFPLLQSWGYSYPHVVWMPYEVSDKVIFQQEGECVVVTDR